MHQLRHLLFICSKNQWRSPTAEDMFKQHQFFQARSAGTSSKARVKVTEKLLAWADVVFVMEKKHKELLNHKFPATARAKQIVVLHIPDNYQRNDPTLIQLLEQKLATFGLTDI